MFCLNDTMRYYLCPGSTDMRKGISSLCGVVHEGMRSDVKNGDVFIFIGQSRRLMKLLHPQSAVRHGRWHRLAGIQVPGRVSRPELGTDGHLPRRLQDCRADTLPRLWHDWRVLQTEIRQ